MKTVPNIVVAGLVLPGCADPHAAAGDHEISLRPPGYHVIKLGGLGGTTSNGNRLNDLGIIGGVEPRRRRGQACRRVARRGFRSTSAPPVVPPPTAR